MCFVILVTCFQWPELPLSDMNLVLHSDLEKSVEELQRNSSVNHGLVTEQDVEQKSKELRMLGETLTELKSEYCVLRLL